MQGLHRQPKILQKDLVPRFPEKHPEDRQRTDPTRTNPRKVGVRYCVDPREIIRRTEHLVVKRCKVSKKDILARYSRSDLTFTGRSIEGDPLPETPFIPTHRIVSYPEKGGTPLAFDYVHKMDYRGPYVPFFPAALENYMGVVTIEDFQRSPMGLDVIREPSYLYDPEKNFWWRYKVPHPDLTKAHLEIAEVDYIKDGPRQNLNLSFAQPTGAVYFLQEDRPNGAIKIGYSTDSKKRLLAHQTSNSVQLKLLVDVPGTFEEESILHRMFKEFRTGGGEEWFEAEPILKWLRSQFFLIL